MRTRPIPYHPRHDIAMNCIVTPRGGKWRCCNIHGIEVYRSFTLGPANRSPKGNMWSAIPGLRAGPSVTLRLTSFPWTLQQRHFPPCGITMQFIAISCRGWYGMGRVLNYHKYLNLLICGYNFKNTLDNLTFLRRTYHLSD